MSYTVCVCGGVLNAITIPPVSPSPYKVIPVPSRATCPQRQNFFLGIHLTPTGSR